MYDILKKLYPNGKAWDFEGDADKLIEAKSDNFQDVKDFIKKLSLIFDAQSSIMLSDLEREYGLSPNGQTEDIRRQRLFGAMTMRDDIAPLIVDPTLITCHIVVSVIDIVVTRLIAKARYQSPDFITI